MLDAETLALATKAALHPDVSLADIGLPDTDETRAVVDEIRRWADDLPEGLSVDIPWEYPDAGSADHLYDEPAEELADRLFGDTDSTPEDVEQGVTKAVGEAMFTLGPMYVPDRLDAHNEWTDADELQKAVWAYSASPDRDIRLQHNRDVVAGRWSEIVTWPYEVTVPMLKADGSSSMVTYPANTVFLGVHWEPWAWELVKAGKLRGYSVGGRAKRIEVDLDGAA